MAATGLNVTPKEYQYDNERNYKVPMGIVTAIFFMWAVGVNINDILIPHLKKACDLTDFQSSLIPFVFFGGYFLMARPAGTIIKKNGYKKGLAIGLCFCALGAFLFYPAAGVRSFSFFLFAIFVLACGNSTLEVGAYPLAASLGHPKGASARLNFAAAFNALGAVITSLVGRSFILSGIQKTPEEIAVMTSTDLDAYRLLEAGTVKTPYLILAGIFLLMAVIVFFAPIPEVKTSEESNTPTPVDGEKKKLFHFPHLWMGVLGIFFYVGAQVGVASFIFRYSEVQLPGINEKQAALYITWHLIAFLIGRFIGTALQKAIEPRKLLALFALLSVLLGVAAIILNGITGVWAVILLGFFHSIMFPTIFALALDKLGSYTKDGSTWLVMGIVGGAIVPLAMGYLSDVLSIKSAFIVPVLCYLYVIFYAVKGYRVKKAATESL